MNLQWLLKLTRALVQIDHWLSARTWKLSMPYVIPRTHLFRCITFAEWIRLLGYFQELGISLWSSIEAVMSPMGISFYYILSWWEQRHRENILVVQYEDLNENPLPVVKDISRFLRLTHEDSTLQQLVEWCSFNNMKKQPSTNYQHFTHKYRLDISPYMRRGQVGDWKNYFNEEENNYIDNLYEVRCKPVKLFFKFE